MVRNEKNYDFSSKSVDFESLLPLFKK